MFKFDFKSYLIENPLGMFDVNGIPPVSRNNKITAPLFKTDVAGKLKKILDKTRWNFNFRFVYEYPGVDNRKYFSGANTDNSINIIFPQKFYMDAADSVKDVKGFFGLSPWMMLHRIGHLVISHKLESIVSDLMVNYRNNSVIDPNTKASHNPTLKFFAFKSAKFSHNNPDDNRSISSLDSLEFPIELVAEYLWHGGNIRLINNPPVEIIRDVEKIKIEIAKRLDSMVGKTMYV